MGDIFDQVAAKPKGDIFDQVAASPVPRSAAFLGNQALAQINPTLQGTQVARLPQPNMQEAGGLSRFLTAAGAALPSGPNVPPGGTLAATSLANLNNQTPSAVVNSIGSTASRIGGGDIAGGLGEATTQAAQIELMRRGLTGAVRSNPLHAPAPIPRDVAVEQITNAVNPPPKKMPMVRAMLAKHLDAIAAEATNGIPDRATLAQVTAKAGETARAQFQSLLDPIKDIRVNVNSAPGGPASYQPLGRLYARLVEINNTLDPKYAKGGTVGQAAVGAEQASALRAEGAKIRSILYPEMGKRLNMAPEDIAAINARSGGLKKLAETIQLAADKAQSEVNIQAQKPADLHITTLGALNKIISMARGNPADTSISNAFSNRSTSKLTLNPTVSEPPTPTTNRRPIWSGIEPGRPAQLFDATPMSDAEVRGKINYRANVNARRIEDIQAQKMDELQRALEKKQANRASHGKYKQP